jgi:hypothetical protein
MVVSALSFGPVSQQCSGTSAPFINDVGYDPGSSQGVLATIDDCDESTSPSFGSMTLRRSNVLSNVTNFTYEDPQTLDFETFGATANAGPDVLIYNGTGGWKTAAGDTIPAQTIAWHL